jgi:hypothetical protein
MIRHAKDRNPERTSGSVPEASGKPPRHHSTTAEEARNLCDRVVESSPCHPGFAAWVPHLLGDIASHPDRFDAERGEAQYEAALALAEPRGMRPLVAHCHLGLAKLYRRTSKADPAHEHLTTAATMYREMGMQFWLEQAEAEMEKLA